MDGPIHNERNMRAATETSINFIRDRFDLTVVHSRCRRAGRRESQMNKWPDEKKRTNKKRETTEIVAPTDKLN